MIGRAAGLALTLAAGWAQADVPVVSFTGADAYALIGVRSALQIPSNHALTFESWVYLRTLDSRDCLYSKNTARTTSGYSYMFGFIDNGDIAAYPGSGSWKKPSPIVKVATGQWYHVAFSFDGTNMAYFLNGEPAGSSTFSFVNNAAHTVKIGGYASGYDIDGLQSDVRVWDHARTADQIKKGRNSRLTGSEPGLLGYWMFSEGTGPVVNDSTANASTGTLYGAAWTTAPLAFKPDITLYNQVTGSEDYTNSNEVDVVFTGSLEGYDRYRFTQSDVEPAGGWLVLDPTNPPATLVFSVPDPEGKVTVYCWLKNEAGTLPVYAASNSITYIRESAAVAAVTTNITRTLIGTNNAVINILSLDKGSAAGSLSIFSRALSCDGDLTPERADVVTLANPGVSNDYAVTLTIMDVAGNTGSAVGILTLLPSTNGVYTWNGSGVSNGNANSQWLWSDNWQVGGALPASPPGPDNDAAITLNLTHTTAVVVAVAVGSGATARHVTFRGTSLTNRVEIRGDATFSTLDYNTTRSTFSILADATLTLTGGAINPATDAVVKSTLVTPGALGTMYSSIAYPGTLRFTGNQVVLNLVGPVDGRMYIDDPTATVHFNNTIVGMGGDLFVYDTQRLIGFNSAIGIRPLRSSDDLYSRNGNPLTNWYACNVGGLTYTLDSGAPFTLPAGTYKSVSASFDSTYTANVLYEISGDVTFCGTNGGGYAVYVQRRNYSGTTATAGGAEIGLNSNTLAVVGGGPIRIGEFAVEGSVQAASVWWNRLRAQGAAIVTDGSLQIGPGGYIAGDAATTISLARNWDNRGQWQTNNFTLQASTLALAGAADPGSPQTIEAQSVDLGATTNGMIRNHALGRLEIGTAEQATHAKLVERDDLRGDGASDALYVGELVVQAGSTLDLAGLNLYVNGVSAFRRWTAFGPGLVFDSTLPKGTLLLIR
jgi:hypothetical protein